MYKIFLFFLSLSFILNSCSSSSEYDLFAFENSNGDWGYFDKEGKIVITPQFKSAFAFHDGLAMVEIEFDDKSKFTYIDKEGNYDILKNWDKAISFNDGLAIVRNDLGYPLAIDTNLEVVLEFPNAVFISGFSKGLAFHISKVPEYDDIPFIEIIDKNGVTIDNILYEGGAKGGMFLNYFSEGVFIASEAAVNDAGRYEKQQLVAINDEGKVITRFDDGLESLSPFNNGLALAQFSDDKWGVVNKKGEIIINPQFNKIYFDGDDYIVKVGKKWGWIDSEGQFIINPQFKDIRNRGFNGTDLAAVKVGDKWGFVNKQGKLDINPQFESASPFFGNVALVYKRKSGHGLIDSEGKFVANPQFDDVLPEYYTKKIYGVNEEIDFKSRNNAFLIESDYVNIDGMDDVIRSNITGISRGLYGLATDQVTLSNFLEAKANDSLIFKKSCDQSEGYMINKISNYQNSYYKYDANGYYEGYKKSGYYAISPNGKTPTSGMYATDGKSNAVTNSFKVSFDDSKAYDSDSSRAVSCDDALRLNYITFSADVWASKKVRKGFNEVTNKFYSSSNDKLSEFQGVRINFRTSHQYLNESKRNTITDRLNDAFAGVGNDGCLEWSPDVYFSYNFLVSSDGSITLNLNKCGDSGYD